MATRKTTSAGQSGVLSTGDWLVSLLLLAIPIVGLIVILVWAFGGSANYNKRNFCRASLILMAVFIVLGLIFSVMVGSLFGSIFDLISGL